MTGDVHQLTDPLCYHAEGPVWSPHEGLRWVDMLAGDVLARDAATGAVTRRHVDEVAAALRPRAGGGWVVAGARRFLLLDPDGGRRMLPELWDDTGVRFNDGDCDPQGRFWCGTLAPREGEAALWRLDPGGRAEKVLTGLTLSNGLGWTPDGATAYHVDTPTGRVDALDGSLDPASRRPHVRIAEEHGKPDGLVVDSEGALWVALFGGGRVRRYTPDGRLDVELRVPVARTTACTLAGDDLRDLVVTTSRENAEDPEPEAGALFTARADVPGIPARTFTG